MRNARDLRLESDYANLRALAAGSGGTLVIERAKGLPPDEYILVYKCRTIERLERGKPVYRNLNRVEIKLPAKYPAPFDAPRVRMLTPVWHPHVYKNLVVCMGDWTTSEYLDVFALRLGALLQFEKEFFDVRDPANEEAIDWARRNLLLFPTDTCTFRDDPPERPEAEPAPAGFMMAGLPQPPAHAGDAHGLSAGSAPSTLAARPQPPARAAEAQGEEPAGGDDQRLASSVDAEAILWVELS